MDVLLEKFSLQNRSFTKLVGLKSSEFETLQSAFSKYWEGYFETYTLKKESRQRRSTQRRNSTFTDSSEALFFVLLYLNNHATQEELSKLFGIDQPRVSKYLQLAKQLLAETFQKEKGVLPKQKKERLNAIIEGKKIDYFNMINQ